MPGSGEWEEGVNEIEKIIGYSFKNKDLLKEAFTHRNFASGEKHYEKLEVLGDSVCDLAFSVNMIHSGIAQKISPE